MIRLFTIFPTDLVEFTDEEGYGRYLDLHDCYLKYINLKSSEVSGMGVWAAPVLQAEGVFFGLFAVIWFCGKFLSKQQFQTHFAHAAWKHLRAGYCFVTLLLGPPQPMCLSLL